MSDLHQRLEQVLDAYGASPDRWPAEERAVLLALLEESADARARRDEAARLDALLDAGGGVEPPSSDVRSRILDAAPVAPEAKAPRATRHGWRWAAIVPMAAAAALAIWIAREPAPSVSDESLQIAMAELGVYETPTDVWLEIDGFDPLASVPGYDCEDQDLGCMELGLEIDADQHSMQGGSRRMRT